MRRAWEVSRLEKPSYTVLRPLSDHSEVRRYNPFIIAEAMLSDAETGGELKNAMNQGFKSVAGYIFGGNTKRESVAMTSPVRAERTSESVSMTSPVRSERSGNGFRVSFVMPSKYTLDTLPVPKSNNIKFREVASHDAAAITFGGSMGDCAAAKEKYTQILLGQMDVAGLKAKGEPVLCEYHPPFAPSFIRKREIVIPL